MKTLTLIALAIGTLTGCRSQSENPVVPEPTQEQHLEELQADLEEDLQRSLEKLLQEKLSSQQFGYSVPNVTVTQPKIEWGLPPQKPLEEMFQVASPSTWLWYWSRETR